MEDLNLDENKGMITEENLEEKKEEVSKKDQKEIVFNFNFPVTF